MKIETVTLHIPGLTRSYTFYHTSDCHIAYAGPEESEEAKALADRQIAAWSYAGRTPDEALEEVLRIVDEAHADGLFLCGDIVDYLSEGNLAALRERVSRVSTELFYVCGNHERSFAAPEVAQIRGFYPAYADLMHGSPAFWVRDFGEFVIVGMDDGDKKIRQEQLDLLEAQFAKGKPILLLIHIPILTDAIIGPVKEKWGEDGATYFLLGQESDTELSRRFCRLLASPDNPIAAVFAGHIHLSHIGELTAGRMQYTSGPAFEGVIRKVVLCADA